MELDQRGYGQAAIGSPLPVVLRPRFRPRRTVMLDRYGPADDTDVGPAARDAHLQPLEEYLAERSAEDAWVADLLATPPPSTTHDGPPDPLILPTPPAWLTEDLAPGDDDAGVPAWVGLLDDPEAGTAVDAAHASDAAGTRDAAGTHDAAGTRGAAADPPALTHLVQHDPDLARRIVAGMAPGPALALFLQTVDLRDVDDATRLGAWAHAITTRTAAELADRPAMNPHWPTDIPTPARPGVAAEEISMRLACSTRSAQSLIDQGRAFAGPMWPTGEALADGSIGPAASRILVDRLATLDPELTIEVQEVVLPAAPRRTPAQLRQDVERALIDLDPAGAEGRARRARRGRCVYRPRPLPDGMASLTAVLPTTTAVEVYATLDHAAHHARRSGDPRTLDQLRADHLHHWVITTPDPTMLTTPGASPGSGALPTSGTLPTSGVLPTSATALASGRNPAPDPAPTSSSADGALRGTAPGALSPPSATSRPPGRSVAPDGTSRRPRADIRVHVALSTLLGLDDRPAEIAGYGPVDAAQARSLAIGGTWRRIVTDPLSGAVFDVGRTRYRPPQDLVDHIEERDRCCARPGCTRPAQSCDLDHTTPFGPVPDGGGAQRDRDKARREDGRAQSGPAGAQPLPAGAQPLPDGAQSLPAGAQDRDTDPQRDDGGAPPDETGAPPDDGARHEHVDLRAARSGAHRDRGRGSAEAQHEDVGAYDDHGEVRSETGDTRLDRDHDDAQPDQDTTVSGDAGTRRYHPALAALLAREAAQDPDDPAVLRAGTRAGVNRSGPGPAEVLGTTSATNFGPLCRRDHLLKTHAGYRLIQTSPGQFEWITPTGHRYRDIPGAGGSSSHDGVIPF